jgi:methylated-DNA-[protein]-cysteine S-methyltransferase
MATGFEQRVYAFVAGIPPGRVCTYGDVARAIGCGSARAVGQALRRSPGLPEVPCHRVIAAGGRLGGFQGGAPGAGARKRELLNREGVGFAGDRLVDLGRLWQPG